MIDQSPATKAVATVRDVARMVGLSPARFYQLQRDGIFPWPLYDVATRRPHYTEEQQRECLEVRRRNCGVNGRPILFYARRLETTSAARPRTGRTAGGKGAEAYTDLVAGLKALGLTTVTADQVGVAVPQVFPAGTVGVGHGDVLRAVFIHLRRQNSGDKPGR